jgi:hypothetical protein
MSDQIQCPNCGGYFIEPLNLGTGFSGCLDAILQAVTFRFYDAARARERRWQEEWLIGNVRARCKICDYEFSGREAIDPARIAGNVGLSVSGSERLEHEEGSADQTKSN